MSFGFYEHGFLQINFTNFTYTVSPTTDLPTTLVRFQQFSDNIYLN